MNVPVLHAQPHHAAAPSAGHDKGQDKGLPPVSDDETSYLSVPYEYDVRIFKNRVNDLILSHKVM